MVPVAREPSVMNFLLLISMVFFYSAWLKYAEFPSGVW